MGWFNKTFIHTGKMEVKYSKIITKGYNLRTKGDYATIYDLDTQEILQMFGEMTDFIQEIERFLKTP